MGRFADFIDSRPAQIRKLVDQTQERMKRRSGLTDEYFPLDTIDDFDLLWVSMQDQMPIASVVGFEGEIPTTKSGRLDEFSKEIFKLGISHLWTENDFKLMLKYEQRIDGLPQSFKNRIFGSVQGLLPRIVGLMDLLMWQVIYNKGVCNYKDPRTKIAAKVTYPVEASLNPTALAGAAQWSNSATANGLQNLQDQAEAFYAVHGYFPDVTAMSRSDYNKLRNQESTKNAAVAKTGSAASATDTVVSPMLLADLLADREIPPIYVNERGQVGFDDEVEVESSAGVISRQRLLPVGYFAFLTKKQALMDDMGNDSGTMGQRILGPTVEAEGAAGIHVDTEEISKSPRKDRVFAVATGLPVVWDSRLISALKVD